MNINNCSPCACGCSPSCDTGCVLRITYPGSFSTVDRLRHIKGVSQPNETVQIIIDNHRPLVTTADGRGIFCVAAPRWLHDGVHTIRAVSCPSGCCARVSFRIKRHCFEARLVAARMGRTFRTVDVDVLMHGTTGTATVYYLLLPPGSPAPSAQQVIRYGNTASLLDGTAASGQLTSPVATQPTTYTWALTGLDKPEAPAGTTGVVDGYRYDVYLYVVSGSCTSGVLTAPNAAMGMPFATGLGTDDSPFTIRELTDQELARYPDLLAGNALNEPGVDETARQLENIERLVTLYERTDGYYGLEDSMALHYLMTSDMDLAGYAAAYDGAGWESIGDIDGWINDRKENEHLFSGVFDGDGHTITNLNITPVATDDYFVGYRGLFGGVEGGTLENLSLEGVRIDAYTTVPGYAQLGAFISIARSPRLRGLSLHSASLSADCDTVSFGDPHMINMGGFVGAIYDGGEVCDITGTYIYLSVPSAHALAMGGFVGYTDRFAAYDSYKDITLRSLTISGYAMVGGFGGYLVYGVGLMQRVAASGVTITAPGGQAGGLVGLIREEPPAENGLYPNKLFGARPTLVPNAAGTMEDCSAAAVIHGGGICGGLVGEMYRTEITRCRAEADVTAQSLAGGIVGRSWGGAVWSCLVQRGAIEAAIAHRIVGAISGTLLQGNYATTAVTPVPGTPDPNGLDGGTLPA